MTTITFLTDYGYDDDFAGVCRGVIATICPEARVIDITHGIPRHQVRVGALVLRNTLPYMPPGVHLAVVDPGVGGERLAVALLTGDGRTLVGPDNGLLSLAAQRFGGVAAAADVSLSPFRLEPLSATFHGRDVFAPVAARLAAGAQLADAGEPLEPSELAALDLPEPHVEDGALVAHAVYVDRFGNVQLNVVHDQLADSPLKLGQALELEIRGAPLPARYVTTFADVGAGEVLVYEDAYRALAIAINRGNAAAALALGDDDEVVLRPA